MLRILLLINAIIVQIVAITYYTYLIIIIVVNFNFLTMDRLKIITNFLVISRFVMQILFLVLRVYAFLIHIRSKINDFSSIIISTILGYIPIVLLNKMFHML